MTDKLPRPMEQIIKDIERTLELLKAEIAVLRKQVDKRK